MSRTIPTAARLGAGTSVLALAGALLAACGSGGGAPSAVRAGAAAASSTAAGAAVPAGTVLRVGDQQQLIQTLLGASGAEEAIPYKVDYVQFASGPLVDSGFAAKRIDVGFMGDLPAALAVSSGLAVKAVAAEEGVGADMFLIAEPGIDSVGALRAKSVAYTTGTAEQAFALRALATAGLAQADVKQVNVSLQQLFTVLETGSVDASVVTGVQEEKLFLKQHPDAKVLATNTTVTPPSFGYILATTSALGDPAKEAAMEDFTARLVRASDWAFNHKKQYADRYLVGVEHETSEEADLGVEGGLIQRFVPLDAREPEALQDVVDLEQGAGAIKARFEVQGLFDPATSAKYNRILAGVPQSAPEPG